MSAGASRKVPASRSKTEPNTLGESKRGRHSHSMFEFGATRAHVSQSDRKPYSAIGGDGLAPKPAPGPPPLPTSPPPPPPRAPRPRPPPPTPASGTHSFTASPPPPRPGAP